MKKTILILAAIIANLSAYSQIDVKQKAKNATINRADQKTDQGIEEGLNKAEEGVKNLFKKKEKKEKTSDSTNKKSDEKNTNSSNNDSTGSTSKQEDFKSYSKFDFVPGEQIIYFEDFLQDAVGDFPDKWNTNASGEIVTTGSVPGKWLKTVHTGRYKPEINSSSFPDNFTIEFDILFKSPSPFEQGSSSQTIMLDIYSAANEKIVSADTYDGGSGDGSRFSMQTGGLLDALNWKEGSPGLTVTQSKMLFKPNTIAHVSVWVQKKRGRLYIDETKVFDLPYFLPDGVKINAIGFGSGIHNEGEENLISNVRFAVGAPDMRNKLITEGKLVTRGILFDVNSDKIKSESYGTLKEISQVLKDNPAVKVKILGHTDSDGDDKSNLELSKKRSAAVKNSLSKDFGIDAARMETDGKGESEPASPNTTSEGKANNRRVEFIKL